MTNTERPEVKTVHIYREKLYPCVSRPGPAWRWTYEYSVDGGFRLEYGTHLASMRGWVKRKFPNAKLIKTWEAPSGEYTPGGPVPRTSLHNGHLAPPA